jgi:G:T/U-mismatch repair DNA glycosylase
MVKHPWINEYRICKESQYLIIGTHPPMPYCGKLHFYYGNMNEFWRFLDKIYPDNNLYNNSCPELEDIQKFLKTAKIEITDIVESTDGSPFSMDENMNWTKLNSKLKEDLLTSKIETIYFTSFGGKNSALNLFKKWLKINDYAKVRIPDSKVWRENGLDITLDNKRLNLQILFSPSPTARRSASRINEFQKWLLANPIGTFDDFRIDWYKQKLPKL